MNHYYPDFWQVVKITSQQNPNPIYKLFATWAGSFVGGEEWRMNSGITSIEIEENRILFYGASGSLYICIFKENCYRTSRWSEGILQRFISQSKEKHNADIEILPFTTNWQTINFVES